MQGKMGIVGDRIHWDVFVRTRWSQRLILWSNLGRIRDPLCGPELLKFLQIKGFCEVAAEGLEPPTRGL